MASDKTFKVDQPDDGLNSIHHDDSRTGSSFGTFVNILCAVAGTGILGLPYALKQGGWLALSLSLLGAGMAIYTSQMLIECLYYQPGARLTEFPEIGEAAFGRVGKWFVKVFHYLASLSLACIYILLAGLNVHRILLDYAGREVLPQPALVAISGLVVMVPFALLKSIREVTILSVFGALCTVVVVVAVLVQGALDLSTSVSTLGRSIPDTQLIHIGGLPLSFSTICFSYTGNVVFPHIEATMRNPYAWNRVVTVAIMFVACLYLITGVAGYLCYGDLVKSPVLDSLPKGALSLVSYALITLHVILAAPIYLCSFALEQERWMHIDRESMSAIKEFMCRVVFRVSVVVGLTLIAMFLPYFSDLMSLFGAISGALVVFLIPVACHYKLFGWRHRSPLHHLTAFVILLVGMAGLILGTWFSISALATSIRAGASTTSIQH